MYLILVLAYGTFMIYVSKEGLAPIVKAYSRLILVDGLVLRAVSYYKLHVCSHTKLIV